MLATHIFYFEHNNTAVYKWWQYFIMMYTVIWFNPDLNL